MFAFSNVGMDSEYPGTMQYMWEWAAPFAAEHGLELHWLNPPGKTLYQKLLTGNRSIPIPVKMQNGAPGTRSCTVDYKIRRITKFARQQGATKENRAYIGLGISLDEAHRMRTPTSDKRPYEILDYPLVQLRLRRDECKQIIKDAGLPIPPKSSCWFCPFHNNRVWQDMYNNDREHFDKSVELENLLNERRRSLSRDEIYFSSSLIPLSQVAVTEQLELDLDEDLVVCESGYCMT